MEDDQEDVRVMTEFLKKQKSNYQNNFQLEFQDFINFREDSDHECDEESADEHAFSEFEVEKIKTETIVEVEEGISISTLTTEERSVIESCTDPDLKQLLLLNRSKNVQLIQLQKKIKNLLIECEAKLKEKETLLKNPDPRQFSQQTCIWKLAAPYFKDKRFFGCPLNEDAMRKRSKSELTIYDLTPSPQWTPIEFDRLLNAIKSNYNVNRQAKVVQSIRILKTAASQNDDEHNNKEIIKLNQQLEQLENDNDSVPPLNTNELINWSKISDSYLKEKHTLSEAKAVWQILVHPSINKSEWTDEENQKLETIAKEHSFQDWDSIAAELDNNRTGFTCCLHYFSKLCDKFKKNKFTAEEDTLILELVENYKIGNYIPWNKVVCHFGNRSRHQLYHRYTYFLSQNHVKRGKFSEAEDILLVILVNRFGRNFKKCAEYMPHRSQVQLKSRYNSNLQRHIRKGTFTEEDDKMILDYVKKDGEKNWSPLSHKLNRCNAQVRQRYRIIKSFLEANPEAPLCSVPKRKHHYDKISEEQYNFLDYMADQYKDVDFIPNISMIEESLQVEIKTPVTKKNSRKSRPTLEELKQTAANVKNIDTMLTEVFSNMMQSEQIESITQKNIEEARDHVAEVTAMLGVNLSIPNSFECNIHLDNIDVAILERLSKEKLNYSSSQIDRFGSPNLNTLVGLKSLIIKHKEYKESQKYLPSTSSDNNLTLNKIHEKSESESLIHRSLFSKRFESLFNWSAILSLEKPNPCIVLKESTTTSTSNISNKRTIPGQLPVTAKRRKNDNTIISNNKNRINIIRVETVSNPSAVSSIVEKNNERNLTSTIENIASEKDEEDVKRLNVILKSIKSEVAPSANYDSREYDAIKDDVQLLKEILKYEKSNVKVEPDQ